jgi:hypothetical protein
MHPAKEIAANGALQGFGACVLLFRAGTNFP